MTDTTSDLSTKLAEHPRLIGALFTLLLLLSQAGSAAAAFGTTNSGP